MSDDTRPHSLETETLIARLLWALPNWAEPCVVEDGCCVSHLFDVPCPVLDARTILDGVEE